MINEALTLSKLEGFSGRSGPLLLLIMDGVGIGAPAENNAVFMASTPFLDSVVGTPLYRTLRAHGRAVGMPSDEDMGNSEVGHNALGAGRVFEQGASLVRSAIESGALFTGPAWHDVTAAVRGTSRRLHFIGLLSDGNVHAHCDHLIAMVTRAATDGVGYVRIHVLLDGRDVDEKSALRYIAQLEAVLTDLRHTFGVDYRIASGGGRMVTTMDRYNADWSIVKRGWDAHVLGEARAFGSASEAVLAFYQEDPKATDQYLPAFVISQDGEPIGRIHDGDSVVLFNFRGDRAIELSLAFSQANFSHFDRVRVPDVVFAGMMQYDGDLKIPARFLVEPPTIQNPIGAYLCATGVSSFAISETQKYGHVTYFWNGNKSGYIDRDLETYVEIESDRIPFDQAPEMKAYEITDQTISLLRSGKYRFGRVNFPNGDMVGHTGVMAAAVRACEVTDECVSRLVQVVNDLGGITVVLADHGNADEMFTVKNGIKTPKTAHTLAPVPFAICDAQFAGDYQMRSDLPEAGLPNVAATLCNLLGYEAPEGYCESVLSV